MTSPSPCSVPGCGRRAHSSGKCHTHGERYRSGDQEWYRPIASRRARGETLVRDERGRKQCVTCRGWLPEGNYSRHPTSLDGLAPHCRSCKADRHIASSYGLTREEWDSMFRSQGSACGICQTPEPTDRGWQTDHDHSCCPVRGRSCGKCVRGILCAPCNTAVGHVEANPLMRLLPTWGPFTDWTVRHA